MNLKIATILVALLMTTIVLAETAHALPTDATSWIGPRPQDDCASPQALGYSGASSGTTTGYHSYTQGTGIGALDACLNANGIPGFVNCVVSTQTTADNNGIATITSGPSVPGVIQGVGQLTDPSLGGGNLYQTACSGLGGSGTDGEYEWGTNEAILNVRAGAATAGPEAGFGGGVTSCLGFLATAHHGTDTAIYVSDASLGGGVGFSVYADWARPAGLSASGVDDNRDPGLSTHCGDGTFEPCTTTAQAGVENDATTYGGPTAAVADMLANAQAPTSSRALNHDLDVEGGCNPLDTVVTVDPYARASEYNWYNATGGLTTAAFGYGGASGMLTVIINQRTQGTCYDTERDCEGGEVNAAGAARVGAVDAEPSFGWVWTGVQPGAVQRCTTGPESPGNTLYVNGLAGTSASCIGDCIGAHIMTADWSAGSGTIQTSVSGCTSPSISDSVSASASMPSNAKWITPSSSNGVYTCTVTVVGGVGISSGHGSCHDP